MAGILRAHGVWVGLALALVVSSLAAGEAGAETRGHAISGEEQGWNLAGSRKVMDACSDLSNPIRMPTDQDGLKEVSFDAALSRHSASTPQKLAVDMGMPRNEQEAAAPADAPSACGSTSLAVSLLMCVGMTLLSLVVA
ncbi:hypothetical protein Taro_000376 [Colocasia esculenta]|uniref:Uncharacterized protein n=1 Tax=Colocasia esculenta TaxID=4460 RepID=A0A843TC12_COLES|nr:hypothetical protein [Colocasia esculenta]